MRKRTPAPCLAEGCPRLNGGSRGYCDMHYQRVMKYGDPNGGYFVKYASFEQRLDQYADKSGGPDACWPWTGNLDRYGYGNHHFKDAPTRTAHRLAYMTWVGPISDDLTVDHLCHDPSQCQAGDTCLHRRCVNPRHLKAASIADNTLRGDGPAARNARKTQCKRGHPFDEANTKIDSAGHRMCVTCRRTSWTAQNAKRYASARLR